MQPIVTNMAALTVATLFYLWRAHHQTRQRRRLLLRERVAYMLWVMAEQIQGREAELPAACRG
jgi:hypothetical protein